MTRKKAIEYSNKLIKCLEWVTSAYIIADQRFKKARSEDDIKSAIDYKMERNRERQTIAATIQAIRMLSDGKFDLLFHVDEDNLWFSLLQEHTVEELILHSQDLI